LYPTFDLNKKTLLKSIISLILLVFLFASCKSSSALIKKTNKIESRENQRIADNLIDAASEDLGVPYKTAGTTKNGYDCSGLVFSTFAKYDIALPRTSFDQAKQGTLLGKNLREAKKGDLIFFKTNNRTQINHVGIVTEVNDDEVRFIHTSTSKGVIISSTKEPYYQRTFVQLNRILN
jgi:cell wall-associated NlpC family hydrolase